MSRYAALLRGINVAGHNMLPMKELVPMFEAVGCTDVESYIQSGNVVFAAPATLARKVPELVAAKIKGRFRYDTPILVRSAAALAQVAASNPFLAGVAPSNGTYVAFLANAPAKALVDALDPNRSPPDAFAVRGTEVFLHYPNGAGRTKLTNVYLESKLATIATSRNWRTLLQLVEMTQSRRASRARTT